MKLSTLVETGSNQQIGFDSRFIRLFQGSSRALKSVLYSRLMEPHLRFSFPMQGHILNIVGDALYQWVPWLQQQKKCAGGTSGFFGYIPVLVPETGIKYKTSLVWPEVWYQLDTSSSWYQCWYEHWYQVDIRPTLVYTYLLGCNMGIWY
jgi:hypothetical protein